MSLTQEQKMQDYGEFLKALRLVPQLRVAFTMNNYQKARERASFVFNLAPDSLYSVGVFSAVIAELHNHMEHGDLPEIVDPHEFDNILTPEFVQSATAAQIRALTQRQAPRQTGGDQGGSTNGRSFGGSAQSRGGGRLHG